jgi:signal transduction histidine kinase
VRAALRVDAIHHRVDRLGDARVPPAVETAAFRILQESLFNASRHARSTSVEVELSRQERWLHLEVRDDGVGLDDAAVANARVPFNDGEWADADVRAELSVGV